MGRFHLDTIGVIFLFGLILMQPSTAAGPFVINAQSGSGGSISPSGNVEVPAGGTQVFIILAQTGFVIRDVLVDGNSVGPVPLYTFTKVNKDHTISASFIVSTGSVSVASDPGGASVFIDGINYGRTRNKIPILIEGISVGSHVLLLSLSGYQDWQTDITIREGETTIIAPVILRPLVTPTIPPTTVPTPTITTIPPTTIVTSLPTSTTTIPTATPIPTTSPMFPLTTIQTTPTTSPVTGYGSMFIASDPRDAIVRVDGEEKGRTNTIITHLPAGTHEVTLEKRGYRTEILSVRINADAMVRLPIIKLVPEFPQNVTTVTTIPSISVLTTVPESAATGISVNTTVNQTTVPQAPPNYPEWSLILAIITLGGLGVILVSHDLVKDTWTLPSGSPRVRLIILAGYTISVTGFAIALAGLDAGRELLAIPSPFVFVLILLVYYLVVSTLVLICGELVSRLPEWTLQGHLFISVLVLFIAFLALISGGNEGRLPLVIAFSSALLSAILSRWQYTAGTEAGGRNLPPSTADYGQTLVSAPPTPDLFPSGLSGKYSDVQFIGMGGIARVFRAVNSRTGQTVALKIPVNSDETSGKCFMKEIKVWEDLVHPNIVKVSEVNILPVPYVEMEYIRTTLADLKKPLHNEDALAIMKGIARGIEYAHSRGIVHRDIKPHNILITPEGVPKITDWGMSKVMGTCMLPTITGFSLSYASPEQVSPGTYGETDPRTDIYQLGVVFYELVTGKVPYAGDDIMEVTNRILNQDPPLPSSLNPLAAIFDGIIMECLARDPNSRYQTASSLIADLERFFAMNNGSDRYEIFED